MKKEDDDNQVRIMLALYRMSIIQPCNKLPLENKLSIKAYRVLFPNSG
jgi:hypothetical protein